MRDQFRAEDRGGPLTTPVAAGAIACVIAALTVVACAANPSFAPDAGALPDAGDPVDAGLGFPVEPIEVSCDGFDNDGDGRVDVSRPVRLGSTTFWAFSAQRNGRQVVNVWIDNGVRYGFLDLPSLSSSDLALDVSSEAYAPILYPTSGSIIATWIVSDGGLDVLRASSIKLDGGLGPRVEVTRQKNLASGFRAARPRDGACTVLMWTDSCAGWVRIALSHADDGSLLAGPTGVTPTTPPQCNIGAPTPLLSFGASEIALLNAGVGGGQPLLELDRFDCALQRSQPVAIPLPVTWTYGDDWFYPDVTPLDESDAGRGDDLAFALVGSLGGVLWTRHSDGGSSDPLLFTADGGQRFSATPVSGRAGPFLFMRESPKDGGPVAYFARGRTEKFDLSVAGAFPGATVLSVGDGTALMGFVLDAGIGSEGGIQMARYFQRFCEPK